MSKPRDPTGTECHGSKCRWDNGIFTPSFNREGEVASIPLKQREEKRQAFSKEGGAGNQGEGQVVLYYHYVKQAIPTFTMSCEFEGCVYAIEKDEEMLMSVAEGFLGIHHTFHEWGYIYTMEGFIMPVNPRRRRSPFSQYKARRSSLSHQQRLPKR